MRHTQAMRSCALQAGLLASFGLGFLGGPEVPRASAAPLCLEEGQCGFDRPLILFVVDYSTSMNAKFDAESTRWQATQGALVATIDALNGDLQGNAIVGLMRFGHDPKVGATGTTIDGDVSIPKLTDGQALDVAFYDEQAPDKHYYECNGEAVAAAVAALPPPLGGELVGIGSWTRGALERAKAYFVQTASDHPEDMGARPGAIVLITDGEWTDPSGTMKLQPADQDPALTAKDLFDDHGIPTYVVAIAEAAGKPYADALAVNGGTGAATDVVHPLALADKLLAVADDVLQNALKPRCGAVLPRIMVLLDASSSMLNIGGGTQAGGMGETGWDQAREALSGSDSLFDPLIGGLKAEDRVLLGLAVFGHNDPPPGEQKLVVDYGACHRQNFAWALDPTSSCVQPGCTDPWGGPPITWTFQDGSLLDPPGFDAKTLSHMPRCNASVPLPLACVGSGTYTHLGLQLVQQNIAAHKLLCGEPKHPFPCDADTPFINILITDGLYNSTDAQVQGPLQQMYANGVPTFVIGFGDLVNTMEAMAKLQNMAQWGSGDLESYFDANNQMDLEAALAAIVQGLAFDPCCPGLGCTVSCEPGPCGCGEPDPNGCGDGVQCPGEECDDGELVDGDGCSKLCTLEPWNPSTTGGAMTTTGESSSGSTDSSHGTSTTGAGSTDASSTGSSGGEPTTGSAIGTTSTGASSGDSSGAASTTDAQGEGEGCGCRAADPSRALVLATLSLLGLPRRRRSRLAVESVDASVRRGCDGERDRLGSGPR